MAVWKSNLQSRLRYDVRHNQVAALRFSSVGGNRRNAAAPVYSVQRIRFIPSWRDIRCDDQAAVDPPETTLYGRENRSADHGAGDGILTDGSHLGHVTLW